MLSMNRFLLVYEERFEASHGYLRRCVEPAIHRYLDCGIFDHGVARVRCTGCDRAPPRLGTSLNCLPSQSRDRSSSTETSPRS